jgi:hypothetical protein
MSSQQSEFSGFHVIETEEPYNFGFEQEPDLEKLMFFMDREIDFDLEILDEDRFRVEDDRYETPVEVSLEAYDDDLDWKVKPTYQGNSVLAYNLGQQINEIGTDPEREIEEEYNNLLYT